MPRLPAFQPGDRVGDVVGATAVMVRAAEDAQAAEAELICFPEGYLQGYVVDADASAELALERHDAAFEVVLAAFADLDNTVVFGWLERCDGRLHNSAAVVRRGRLLGVYRKMRLLPGEIEVFIAGDASPVFRAATFTFGINICMDLRFPDGARMAAQQGAEVLVCPCTNLLAPDSAAR